MFSKVEPVDKNSTLIGVWNSITYMKSQNSGNPMQFFMEINDDSTFSLFQSKNNPGRLGYYRIEKDTLLLFTNDEKGYFEISLLFEFDHSREIMVINLVNNENNKYNHFVGEWNKVNRWGHKIYLRDTY